MRAILDNIKFKKILNEIKSKGQYYKNLSDKKLQSKTKYFKKLYKSGVSLEKILPDAYAAVSEAMFRTIKIYPFDVQILAAIAMHYGYLCDMKTGEGKTFVAVLPLYLNALTGKTVVLTTANSYLAQRDAKYLSKVYKFMGLSINAGVQKSNNVDLTNEEKKEIYSKDIVYTTHSTIVFDYLMSNLLTNEEENFFLKELFFIVLDEADSILLDASESPLIISGAPYALSNLYGICDTFVKTLKEGRDFEYYLFDKKCWLTEEGIKSAEKYFRIDNLYSKENYELCRHILFALKARLLFIKNEDYVIQDGELKLLDAGIGRVMENTKLNGGIHQAIEQSEGVEITPPTKAMATCTYYSFLSLFEKVSGMSGTLYSEKREIRDLYKYKVFKVPTNKKIIRTDHKVKYYVYNDQRNKDAVKLASELHYANRPVLLIAENIERVQECSELLYEEGIKHNILNAYSDSKEAQMIKEAGVAGNVMLATPMVGRGTDIKLNKQALNNGGLAVIIIGMCANFRIEMQERGRAGRQGDPGDSYLFASMEDEIISKAGGIEIEKVDKPKKLDSGIAKNEIIWAQKQTSNSASDNRENAIDMDKDLQMQRQEIYSLRDSCIKANAFNKNVLEEWTEEIVEDYLYSNDKESVRNFVINTLTSSYTFDIETINKLSRINLYSQLLDIAKSNRISIEKNLKDKNTLKEYYCKCILHAIDECWISQVDYMEQLRSVVASRQYAQKNMKLEYREEARLSYDKMLLDIKKNAVRNFYVSDINFDKKGQLNIMFP